MHISALEGQGDLHSLVSTTTSWLYIVVSSLLTTKVSPSVRALSVQKL